MPLKFKRNNQYIIRYIDKKAHVLSPTEGKLYILNETATFVWRLLWKPRSMEDIINKIMEVYETNRKKAEKDVISFIDFANKVKLIR